jgi:hypothetical protein
MAIRRRRRSTTPQWWRDLSSEQKKQYVRDHPNSKFGRKIKQNRSIRRAFGDKPKGSLHKHLGVPIGRKLAISKLNKLANSNHRLAGRARMVLSLQGYKKTGRR